MLHSKTIFHKIEDDETVKVSISLDKKDFYLFDVGIRNSLVCIDSIGEMRLFDVDILVDISGGITNHRLEIWKYTMLADGDRDFSKIIDCEFVFDVFVPLVIYFDKDDCLITSSDNNKINVMFCEGYNNDLFYNKIARNLNEFSELD